MGKFSQLDPTYKANEILARGAFNTKKLLSEELGISRPTLDSRLSGKTEWGKLERNWLSYLYKKLD